MSGFCRGVCSTRTTCGRRFYRLRYQNIPVAQSLLDDRKDWSPIVGCPLLSAPPWLRLRDCSEVLQLVFPGAPPRPRSLGALCSEDRGCGRTFGFSLSNVYKDHLGSAVHGFRFLLHSRLFSVAFLS